MKTRVVAKPIELPLFDNEALPQSGVVSSRFNFVQYIRDYREFGSNTLELREGGIPYFVNEFWTSAQRAAHSIHEISYRACFKPQLPGFFIEHLTNPGEIVLDPFMGRGTTPIEAQLKGRRAFGNDINPLSLLLTRPRLQVPDVGRIQRILESIPWEKGKIERDDLLVFYHPFTLRRLCALRDWLIREAPLTDTNPDPAADWIRMVALNRLTGHSPGFFSVRTMPPNQAVSIDAQRKINEKNRQEPREKISLNSYSRKQNLSFPMDLQRQNSTHCYSVVQLIAFRKFVTVLYLSSLRLRHSWMSFNMLTIIGCGAGSRTSTQTRLISLCTVMKSYGRLWSRMFLERPLGCSRTADT